jgi:hypothetical protein
MDFYGEFAASAVTCGKCGWTGIGADQISGEAFGDGTGDAVKKTDKPKLKIEKRRVL